MVILLAVIIAIGALLFITESALNVWDRLVQGPRVLLYGYLTLIDRSKDLIISGGANVYPREVEEVLLRHEGVLECAVIGRPHPDWGEEVVAFVVARPGQPLDPAALDAVCLERIARFKRPRAYRIVDSLPKNNYGKVLKTKLRDLSHMEDHRS